MQWEHLLTTATDLTKPTLLLLALFLLAAFSPSHLFGMLTQSAYSLQHMFESWWGGTDTAGRARRLREKRVARREAGGGLLLAHAPRGLFNTGNSCFINSTLQSLASCPAFLDFLSDLSDRADEADSAYPDEDPIAPVAQALLDLVGDINSSTPNHPMMPKSLLEAFGNDRDILNADQQDAQEFFQILSSAIATETSYLRPASTAGLADIASLSSSSRMLLSPSLVGGTPKIVRAETPLRSPFLGLLASRLSCATCNYTAAIRHFTFDNLSCNIPSLQRTSLEACLDDYVQLEALEDARCRRCSLTATLKWLEVRAQKEGLPPKIHRQIAERTDLVKKALLHDPEMDLGKMTLEPGRSTLSTKQILIAQPPKNLCIHLARSTISPYGHIRKNDALVSFPRILDLAPFVTSGTLRTVARASMSTPPPAPILYGLVAVIVHYGSHEDGHYVAFRKGAKKDVLGVAAWWRVSDARVDKVSLDRVLQENPYILFYERLEEGASPNLKPAKKVKKVKKRRKSKTSSRALSQEEGLAVEEDWVEEAEAEAEEEDGPVDKPVEEDPLLEPTPTPTPASLSPPTLPLTDDPPLV